MKEKVLFSWSGGKDSALAFSEMQKKENYQITSLLTTVSLEYGRTSMHGVRRKLLLEQKEALGLPLKEIPISKMQLLEEYESKMEMALKEILKEGVKTVAFGDIFLEDLKKYREEKLSKLGMKAIFPIWKKDTRLLARTFIDSGFKAIITCIDSKVLEKKFVGRIYDDEFLAELPSNVDVCGENGEFHSFVYDGPIFRKKIDFKKGETVLRDKRFWYSDLEPEILH